MQYAVFLLTMWVLASSHCITHSHQTRLHVTGKNTTIKYNAEMTISFTSLKPERNKHREVNNGNTLNTKVVIWGHPAGTASTPNVARVLRATTSKPNKIIIVTTLIMNSNTRFCLLHQKQAFHLQHVLVNSNSLR